jgi:hypothetical protein
MDISIKRKLLELLEVLPYEFQRRVLDFAQALALSTPKGVPGKQLLHFAGAIPAGDLQMMAQAIEAGCERIDWDKWWKPTRHQHRDCPVCSGLGRCRTCEWKERVKTRQERGE